MTMQVQSKVAKFDKMIFTIVIVFLVMIITLISVNYFSNYVKTATKGASQGAVLWSNAQKEAGYHLTSYLHSQKRSDYQQYKKPLEVFEGFRQAALTIVSDNPDYERARQGFIKGRIDPAYIEPLIWFFENFQDLDKIAQSIRIWRKADQKIQEFTAMAEELRASIGNGGLSPDEQNRFSRRIDQLNVSVNRDIRDFVNVMNDIDHLVGSVTFWVNAIVGGLLIFCGGAVAVAFISRAKKWNKTRETKFRQVLNNTRDIIYEINLDSGTYEYITPSVKSQLGYSREEMIENGPEFMFSLIHPDDKDTIEESIHKYLEQNVADVEKESEFRIKTQSGDYIWVSNKHSVVRKNGDPHAVVVNSRDITQRKLYEEKLNEMLDEKVTLLREIHHRVKNNLAVISGLLEMQKEGLGQVVKEAFEVSQSRIQSMALVHEKLYESENLSEINIREYISELIDFIGRSYEADEQDITVEKDIEELDLDIEVAIPLGLILNELITNAFKHGFSESREGTLKVSLAKREGALVLQVADNGKGLPEDFDMENADSLGVTLIRGLTHQIEGELEISTNGWTEFKITIG